MVSMSKNGKSRKRAVIIEINAIIPWKPAKELIKNNLLIVAILSHSALLSVFLAGYDGVNYGVGAQNFAGGGAYQPYGLNSPYGNYPYGYRGSSSNIPTSYSYLRQYHLPVNTNPYGGIGTVGPYGGSSKCQLHVCTCRKLGHNEISFLFS